MRRLLFALPLLFASTLLAQSRVLIYTRNYTPDNKGFIHDNIATSVVALQKIGVEAHLEMDASDDPSVFTPDNLKRYRVIVFSNSNNEAFATQAQRDAFKAWIEDGGGWVGIHSASGSERNWDWFAQMVGGRFLMHPRKQKFTVHVADPNFPAMKGVPADFAVDDECYFTKRFSQDIHPLLTVDTSTLDVKDFKLDRKDFPNPLPVAWWQEFDGGREIYIALGHDKANYQDPLFLGMLRGAILWAMGKPGA
jgi:type 1 glutamine amidotransferase